MRNLAAQSELSDAPLRRSFCKSLITIYETKAHYSVFEASFYKRHNRLETPCDTRKGDKQARAQNTARPEITVKTFSN